MWQRFTEPGRRAILYAQEEAQRFGEGYVSTEHLLLGLCRDEDTTATRILDALGVSTNRIKTEVEKQLPRGDSRPSQDMSLTPRVKRVIDLAYDEAKRLGNDWIGTEHLLLGLIREGDGFAGRVLEKLGIRLEEARQRTMEMLEGRPPSLGPQVNRVPRPPANLHKVVSYFGQAAANLIARMSSEPPARNTAAAVSLVAEHASHLSIAFLVLMILERPSDRLKAALQKLGLEARDVANLLAVDIAAKADEAIASVVTIGQVLNGADHEVDATNAPSYGDEHIVLAAMVLKAPIVADCLHACGIKADAFRAAIAALFDEN